MKPYRGTLLASAVLLATLPFSGCGDPDDWKKTTEIVLSAPTPEGLNEVVFTVVSPPPAEGYACDTLLQYRAEGAGVNIPWSNIPGAETTRVFSVQPQGEGVMTVIARGRCDGSKEDWKYSNTVDVTVTAMAPPTVTAVTVLANPLVVLAAGPNIVTFTISATAESDCTLSLQYSLNGAGLSETGNVPATGVVVVDPTAAGTLSFTATGRCTQNPMAGVSSTVTVTVN